MFSKQCELTSKTTVGESNSAQLPVMSSSLSTNVPTTLHRSADCASEQSRQQKSQSVRGSSAARASARARNKSRSASANRTKKRSKDKRGPDENAFGYASNVQPLRIEDHVQLPATRTVHQLERGKEATAQLRQTNTESDEGIKRSNRGTQLIETAGEEETYHVLQKMDPKLKSKPMARNSGNR